MIPKDENKKRKFFLENEDLGKIKKPKIEITSYDLKNMGKNNDNVIELDINEITEILKPNKKRTISKKTDDKKKPKTKNSAEVKDSQKSSKKVSKEEKDKMIEKYGGYFDENDEFIIDESTDEKINKPYDLRKQNRPDYKNNLDYSSESSEDLDKNIEAIKEKIGYPKKKKKGNQKDEMTKLDLTKEEYEMMTEDELKYWKKISKEERITLKRLEKELDSFDEDEIPERFKILKFPIPLGVKRTIMAKFSQFEMMEPTEPEYFKLSKWIDGIMRIPFGKYLDLPVSKSDSQEKIYEFISKVHHDMESSTYGHHDAKNKIMQVVCQWISNPKSSGNIIALQGPPGIGKTSLVRNGISKALQRPFHMIALGGATDSTFLEGHNYTYEGSNWGRIAEILMESKVMNPVIFFDELDKVSGTKQGEEIIGVLTHLTDQTQNQAFHDKYFSGIDMDLSKCLFVFSYNDESLINPILKDRIVKIHLNGFSTDEKLKIAKSYLLKELTDNIGISPAEFVLSDEIIKEIIQKYTKEEGVRDLRRCLETILLKLNMAKFTNIPSSNTDLKLCEELKDIKFPVTLTSNLIEKILKISKEQESFLTLSKTMMYC